jgi:hypothetical protein
MKLRNRLKKSPLLITLLLSSTAIIACTIPFSQLSTQSPTIHPASETPVSPTQIVSTKTEPTSPLPTPTPYPEDNNDRSTPAPPAANCKEYIHPQSGVSFCYPDNWFLYYKGEREVMIMNAPPGSLTALKHGGDFIAFTVYPMPVDWSDYKSLEEYFEARVRLNPNNGEIRQVTSRPDFPNGYKTLEYVFWGMAEGKVLFVADPEKSLLVNVNIVYPQDGWEDVAYSDVFESVAQSIKIP